MTKDEKIKALDNKLEELTKDIYLRLDVYTEEELEKAIDGIRLIKGALDAIE